MAIFPYKRLQIFFKVGVAFVLTFGVSRNAYAQNADELAQSLQTNYDSSKQVILNLEENEPYHMEDMFWLEMKLLQNMFRRESADAALEFSHKLTQKYEGREKEAAAFLNRGNTFYMIREFEKAIACYDSSILVAKKSMDYQDLGKAYNNIAACQTKLGNYDDALLANAEAIKNLQKLHDTLSVANAYLVRGNTFYAQDVIDKAMASYQKGLDVLKGQKESLIEANLLNGLGLMLSESKQWQKSIPYFERNIEIYESEGATPVQAYVNLGEVYRHLDLEKALQYYQISLDIARESKNKEALFHALNNLALVKEEMGMTEQALKVYNEALEVIDNNYDYPKIAQLLINIANIETSVNSNFERAQKMANLALEKSLQRRELQHIQNSYASLSNIATAQNKFEQALEYANLRDQYKDSVLNQTTLDAVAEYEAKYQSALKDQMIFKERNDKLKAINKQKTAEAEKRESDLVAANQQKWIFGLIGGLLAITFLALFFIQRNRRKAQAEKDAAIILERDKGLQAVISAQEEERKRISKDLHDGIGQQLSGIKLAWQNLSTSMGEKAPEEFSQLMTISSVLDEATAEVRNLSHQMMPRALQESGLVEAIEGMLRKSLQFSDIQYEFDHHNVHSRFPENLELSIYRICQELINNVIKHSEASSVMIQLFKNQNKLILIVEDNGKGIAEDNQNGHGLLNIKSRLNTVKGTVNYEPSPNSGTIATIVVPINQTT